jgi:hypothetical protein
LIQTPSKTSHTKKLHSLSIKDKLGVEDRSKGEHISKHNGTPELQRYKETIYMSS